MEMTPGNWSIVALSLLLIIDPGSQAFAGPKKEIFCKLAGCGEPFKRGRKTPPDPPFLDDFEDIGRDGKPTGDNPCGKSMCSQSDMEDAGWKWASDEGIWWHRNSLFEYCTPKKDGSKCAEGVSASEEDDLHHWPIDVEPLDVDPRPLIDGITNSGREAWLPDVEDDANEQLLNECLPCKHDESSTITYGCYQFCIKYLESRDYRIQSDQ